VVLFGLLTLTGLTGLTGRGLRDGGFPPDGGLDLPVAVVRPGPFLVGLFTIGEWIMHVSGVQLVTP